MFSKPWTLSNKQFTIILGNIYWVIFKTIKIKSLQPFYFAFNCLATNHLHLSIWDTWLVGWFQTSKCKTPKCGQFQKLIKTPQIEDNSRKWRQRQKFRHPKKGEGPKKWREPKNEDNLKMKMTRNMKTTQKKEDNPKKTTPKMKRTQRMKTNLRMMVSPKMFCSMSQKLKATCGMQRTLM